jgi:uncharacterized protein YqjF (DUF2071 family)
MMLPIMQQRWHEISFFHWSCEPSFIQKRLPPGLTVDTFDGKAWIGLTPFLLTGMRPPLTPHAFGLKFPETNLRTYVLGRQGPGIWFFSLDAARLSAVVGARLAYGLPYYWANMRVQLGENENAYFSSRGGRAAVRIRIAKEGPIIERSRLEIFLTERYRLYSVCRSRLITASVAHRPWQLNRVRVLEFDEAIRHAAGVEHPSTDFLSHHSQGVDTKIGLPGRAA